MQPVLERRSARETELDVRFSNYFGFLLNNNLIKINNRGAIQLNIPTKK